MKQTSIDKINKVYVAIKDHEDFKGMAELLKDVIRVEAEKPAKGKKFNFYNYTDNSEIRPIMEGVYHEDGWKVACDSHILVAMKAEYPQDFEKRVLLKNGEFVTYRDRSGNVTDDCPTYPKWRSIIPKEERMEPVTVDAQKFWDWIGEKRVEWKAEHGKGTKFYNGWKVKVGPATLKADKFAMFLDAMAELGTEEILVEDSRRPIMAKTDNGMVILMPILKPETEDDNIVELA